MDRMTMALGGRVAEQVVFDRITTGAQNDLERITKMAYAMVTEYGMSDRLGHVSFTASRSGDEGPLLEKPYSDATAQAIDEEVKALIETARERALQVLQERREELEEMAELLFEREVLGPQELLNILGERPHGKYVDVNGEGRVVRDAGSSQDETRAEEDGSSSESESSDAASETQKNGAP